PDSPAGAGCGGGLLYMEIPPTGKNCPYLRAAHYSRKYPSGKVNLPERQRKGALGHIPGCPDSGQINERSGDMAWILDDTRPIYLQIEDLIKTNIIAGVYQPGQKLPSVRDLAAEASVNPNTMQKALTELERSGLVYTQRTSGRFITEDISKMTELKEQLAREQ